MPRIMKDKILPLSTCRNILFLTQNSQIIRVYLTRIVSHFYGSNKSENFGNLKKIFFIKIKPDLLWSISSGLSAKKMFI